jgi:hypothetical protein
MRDGHRLVKAFAVNPRSDPWFRFCKLGCTTAEIVPIRHLLWVSILLAAAWPSISAAQDKFEIQVYDSETALPGEVGLEMHVNHTFMGSISPSPDGAIPTNRTSRLTFEPHIGVLDWAEAGFYFQTALRPYGAYGGSKTSDLAVK